MVHKRGAQLAAQLGHLLYQREDGLHGANAMYPPACAQPSLEREKNFWRERESGLQSFCLVFAIQTLRGPGMSSLSR